MTAPRTAPSPGCAEDRRAHRGHPAPRLHRALRRQRGRAVPQATRARRDHQRHRWGRGQLLPRAPRPACRARPGLRLTPYARGQYLADAEDEPDASDLERARRFWARCTQSFNSGGAGRRAGWAISAAPGSNVARPTAGLAAQLEAIAGRLSGVYVESADALDLIRKHAGPCALVYADPPDLAETRTGQARSR